MFTVAARCDQVASRVRRLGRPVLSSRLDPDSVQKPFITRSAPLPHIHTDRIRAMPVTTRTTLGGSAPDAQQGASSTSKALVDPGPKGIAATIQRSRLCDALRVGFHLLRG